MSARIKPLLVLGIVLILLFSYVGLRKSGLKKEATNSGQWHPKSISKNLPGGKKGKLIHYGYELITQTSRFIGPDVTNLKMRFAGNNLTCQNCHLKAGTKPEGASFVGVFNRFPQFRKRANRKISIEERVNGCMQRSMNGKPLPIQSLEMKAIVAYMKWLSNGVPKQDLKKYKGYPKIHYPNRKADVTNGKILFEKNCAKCHGSNGQGELNGTDKSHGYRYPPLWGPDSFNNGAGMDRVLKAAAFIKGNMPYGVTEKTQQLTDSECYDIAAFIDSHDRPVKANLSEDYPDKSLKPIDCPYGPYADPFPPNQHKYGPFQPIASYYKTHHKKARASK